VVFQDPHVIVFSFEDSDPSLSLKKMEVDHDATKENILPQRKTRKVTVAPSSSELTSRDNAQDATHKGMMMSGVNLSTTPRSATNGKKKATTPASTPQAVKRALRQSMMDEVDRGEGQIDD
jgi:hypothetical protein